MTPLVSGDLCRLLWTIAERESAHAALEALHRAAGPDTLWCGPGGHVLASVQTVRSARTVRLPDGPHERAVLTETILTTPALARAGLAGLRFDRTGSEPAATDPAWSLPPVWLRFGLSERLRETCLTRLAQRRAGDTPLLQQQMVKGQLADIAIGHLEIGTTLASLDSGAPDLATVLDVNRRITGVDTDLLNLLGAAGYLSDGPGQAAYVSELITDLYLPRPTTDGADA